MLTLYIISVILAVSAGIYIGYIEWYKGRNILISEVAAVLVVCGLPIFNLIFLALTLSEYNKDLILIKGRKND